MNKKMRELLAKMREKQAEADGYLKDGNHVELNRVLEEIEALQAAYRSEKATYELEKNGIPDDDLPSWQSCSASSPLQTRKMH